MLTSTRYQTALSACFGTFAWRSWAAKKSVTSAVQAALIARLCAIRVHGTLTWSFNSLSLTTMKLLVEEAGYGLPLSYCSALEKPRHDEEKGSMENLYDACLT